MWFAVGDGCETVAGDDRPEMLPFLLVGAETIHQQSREDSTEERIRNASLSCSAKTQSDIDQVTAAATELGRKRQAKPPCLHEPVPQLRRMPRAAWPESLYRALDRPFPLQERPAEILQSCLILR
jgi:hypothetical protein